MQDCEPSGTFYAALKHLPVIEPVHFFQIFLLQTYGEGEELWKTIFAPLPLGTWRWKEQELLRYSFELKQPNLTNL